MPAELPVGPLVLVALGFIVGTLGGFFGVGGAFLMTPTLNLLGFPMISAIGTDLALMLGNSVVATLRHHRFGNVDVRLGLYMLIGTALGVWLGKETVFALHAVGAADSVVRYLYIALLFGLATYMIHDYRVHGRHAPAELGADQRLTRLARALRRLRLAPRVDMPVSRLYDMSVWLPIVVGLLTGFLAALLGVGGGFIRVPALIYALGVPTTVAIGTDLFEIIFSSALGTLLYAREGTVHLPAAMIMLAGAVFGAHMGAYATRWVGGAQLRLYFGLTILAAGVGVALKQLAAHTGEQRLATIAIVIVLGAASAMTLTVGAKLAAALRRERRERPT